MYKMKISNREKIMLAIYVVSFVIIALTVAVLQPHDINPPVFSNPPDETGRFLVPKFIFEHGTLPTGLEDETKIPFYGDTSYASLPGLSYIIMGHLMRIVRTVFSDISEFGLIVCARCVNVLCGAVTAFFIWLLGRRIFDKECYVWFFSIATTFLPQHLFIHTYVNTESMCMLSIAIILHSLVRMRQDDVSYSNAVEFAIGASILTLSYYNAYGILLFSIPIFIRFFIRDGKDKGGSFDLKGMLRYGGVIILIWIVFCLWWFIREGIVLDGDFLGMAHRDQAQRGVGIIPLKDKGVSFMQMMTGYRPFFNSKVSFIAAYGSMTILANIWVYRLYELFFIAGFLLIIPVAVHEVRAYKDKDPEHKIFFHIMLLLADATTVALWLTYCYCSDFQAQGRYVFPLLFHFYWIVIKGYEWGLERLPSKLRTGICIALCSAIIIVLISYVYGVAVPVYIGS